MGIALTSVDLTDLPDWFPQQSFQTYVRQVCSSSLFLSPSGRASLDCAARHLSNLESVQRCSINHLPLWSGLFTRVSPHIERSPGARFDGGLVLHRYGCYAGVNGSNQWLSWELQGRYYLFREFEIRANLRRPIYRFCDFASPFVFPSLHLALVYNDEALFHEFVRVLSLSTQWASSDRLRIIGISDKWVRYQTDTKFPMEQDYTKNVVSLSRRYLFGSSCFNAAVEAGYISNVVAFNPIVRSQISLDLSISSSANLLLTGGTTWTSSPVPLYERLRPGGIPTMRGIRAQEFSSHTDQVFWGCDHYLTVGIDQRFQLPKDDRIGFHLFANAGVAKLSKSSIDDPASRDVKTMVGCGAGATCKILDRVFEVNIAAPVIAQGLQFMCAQVGIDLLRSARE
jgi:hypothetical protein